MSKYDKEKQIVTEILTKVDIIPNGTRPWDIQVHDDSVYAQALTGNLALGETYMQGLWDCEALDDFFFRIIRGGLDKKVKFTWSLAAHILKNKLLNLQDKRGAAKLAHYETGNELFQKMLDKRMTYTCGYWETAKDLDTAQEAKLDLICRKLGLKPGMKVLDIGCGWGSFMKYAAEKYGVSCVGLTISRAQAELGRQMCQGLPIEFKLQDYRDEKGEYDRIVSVGMFEHVGQKNHRAYMETVHRCLKDNGLFLLHCVGANPFVRNDAPDPWISKYIFGNYLVPSIMNIGDATHDLFIMEDWHNFGAYYDLTLMAWFHNFEKNWPAIKKDYDEVFFRMWKYYLLSLAGAFRTRTLPLWQIVLSKEGVLGGYKSIR